MLLMAKGTFKPMVVQYINNKTRKLATVMEKICVKYLFIYLLLQGLKFSCVDATDEIRSNY